MLKKQYTSFEYICNHIYTLKVNKLLIFSKEEEAILKFSLGAYGYGNVCDGYLFDSLSCAFFICYSIFITLKYLRSNLFINMVLSLCALENFIRS